MNQTAAIAAALLNGEVVSIKTAFTQFGCSNAPREIGRSIERKFGVEVSKTPTKFKSKYGKSGVYFRYRLNQTEYNKEGIEKMRQYVKEHSGEEVPVPKPKPIKPTKQESTIFSQSKMF